MTRTAVVPVASNPVCGAEYVRAGGRQPGDRTVRCDLPAGHDGGHEDTDTGSMWPATGVDLPGSRAGRELAAHIGAYSASKAIQAGWDALRPLIAARPDLIHPGVADYVAATVLDGAIGVVTGDAIRDAEARGYARAVAALRERDELIKLLYGVYSRWCALGARHDMDAVCDAVEQQAERLDAVLAEAKRGYLEVVAPEGGAGDGD